MTKIGSTVIHSPKAFSKKISRYNQKKLRKGFSRRAAIKPVIGHLKANYRLSRNFYKGIKGDAINVMLAAAAMNFKRMINIWKEFFLVILLNIDQLLYRQRYQQYFLKSLFQA